MPRGVRSGEAIHFKASLLGPSLQLTVAANSRYFFRNQVGHRSSFAYTAVDCLGRYRLGSTPEFASAPSLPVIDLTKSVIKQLLGAI